MTHNNAIEKTMTTIKVEQLAALAQKRKTAHRDGFMNLSDFDRRYECDLVSPVTKSAGNINSEILVLLQDSSSEDAMNLPFEPEAARLGYSPKIPTFQNLIRLLCEHLGKKLSDVYATNLFPLIKSGNMSSPIAAGDMSWAAKEFGIPHIKILAPRLVIVLGASAFDAIGVNIGREYTPKIGSAIEAPFDFNGATIWCQAHTGARGTNNRGASKVATDWQKMAAWYQCTAA